MPTVTITRNEYGKLDGFDEADKRGYARLKKVLAALMPNTTLVLKFWVPRSPKFHRYHFAILGALFKAQEQFADEDVMRKWAEIGAGYCQLVPGPKGKMCAMPLSISYEKLDDVEFQEHHAKVKQFLRSVHATRFLWGHLNDMQGLAMIDAIFDSFELG